MEILEPDNQHYQRVQPLVQTGALTNFIMKMSGGKIKDEKTAIFTLTVVVVLLLVFTFFVGLKPILFPNNEGIKASRDHHQPN